MPCHLPRLIREYLAEMARGDCVHTSSACSVGVGDGVVSVVALCLVAMPPRTNMCQDVLYSPSVCWSACARQVTELCCNEILQSHRT
jgi:hypothetical protein